MPTSGPKDPCCRGREGLWILGSLAPLSLSHRREPGAGAPAAVPAPQQGLQPGIRLQVFIVAGTKAGAAAPQGRSRAALGKVWKAAEERDPPCRGSRLTASRRRWRGGSEGGSEVGSSRIRDAHLGVPPSS